MNDESEMKYILETTIGNASENHEAYQRFQSEHHMHLNKRTVKNISILDYIDEYLGMIPELYKIVQRMSQEKSTSYSKLHAV
jgi:hypothetical protein